MVSCGHQCSPLGATRMPAKHETAASDGRMPAELWECLVPWLPPRHPHPVGGHRPRVDERTAMEALVFVLRPGCPWGAVDATGLWSQSAAHRRCQAWTAADVGGALGEQGLV